MHMPMLPADGCVPVGRMGNTAYFRLAPDILFVIPDDGARDDGMSAAINVDFQTQFARGVGAPVALVVRMTSLMSQDADARRVYAARMDPQLFYAAALVAENPISRAIASFMIGLNKPLFPTRVLDSYASAITWVESHRRGAAS